MNTREINEALANVKCFVGTFCCDELPNVNKRPAALIANTDPCSEPGEHWIAIILQKNGQGQYFDSFGLPPLNEEFINFMNTNCESGWKYNSKTLQSVTSSTCGMYCVYFVKYFCSNDKGFYRLFTENSAVNDFLIKFYVKNKTI